jgi:hypothetical protein
MNTLRETCLGLPLAGERVLSDGERVILQNEARRFLFQGCAGGCLIPIVFFGGLMFAAGTFDAMKDSPYQGIVMVVCLVASLLIPAIVVLLTNDSQGAGKSARKDLREGRVKIYRGQPLGVTEGAEIEAEIGGVRLKLSTPVTLEVLTASRRLWHINEQRVSKFVVLPKEHTASLPPQAALAAKWAQPAVRVAENVLDASQSGRRDLSSEEREEIRRRARTLWRRPTFIAAALLAWIIMCLIPVIFYGARLKVEPGAYLLIVAALWACYQSARTLTWSWRLARDAENGFVIVTRLPAPNHAAGPAGEHVVGPVVELLPASKWAWSADGQPLSWRLRN